MLPPGVWHLYFDQVSQAGCHNSIATNPDANLHFLALPCSHSNLTRAVAPFGLKEEDVHDVLNAFMCTGFTRDTNQYFTKPSPVRVGDYIEFLGEQDCNSFVTSDMTYVCICSVSSCCTGVWASGSHVTIIALGSSLFCCLCHSTWWL
jgi:uncharacterized protein YcgI (DUF1989 family)